MFLGIDLGGTKLSLAVFTPEGTILHKQTAALQNRKGREAGALITHEIKKMTDTTGVTLQAIGIAVPGIYRQKTGTVWAPNIPDWDDYPLRQEVQQATDVPVIIDSDRACYILGEWWQGNARGCADAIYLAVGTGIGAGILTEGRILRGAHDIAGAIGWLALDRPYAEKYRACGCFEYHASGEGLVRIAKELIAKNPEYEKAWQHKKEALTAPALFTAYEENDPLAQAVLQQAIQFWGMALANLVSLFNPEKIILGGGVFGPAVQFIPDIKAEAEKWAQPISMKLVSIEASALGSDAGLYGAGFLALQQFNPSHV